MHHLNVRCLLGFLCSVFRAEKAAMVAVDEVGEVMAVVMVQAATVEVDMVVVDMVVVDMVEEDMGARAVEEAATVGAVMVVVVCV